MTNSECKSYIEDLPNPNIPKEKKAEALKHYVKNTDKVYIKNEFLSNAIIYLSDMIDWNLPDWIESDRMNEQLICSMLSEIEHGFISYGNLHGNDNEGCKFIASALKKQIPMKPIYRWTGDETVIECAACRKYPFDLSEGEEYRKHCGCCGQAIDYRFEE